MYKIELLNFDNITEGRLKICYDYTNKIIAKYNFMINIDSIEKLINNYEIFLSYSSNNKIFLIINKNDIDAIVWYYSCKDWAGKEQQCFRISTSLSININSLNPFIKEVIDKNRIPDKECCFITFNDELIDFAASQKGKIQLNGNRYSLDKNDIDFSLLEKWIQNGESINPNFHVEFNNGIKEGNIEEYCLLFNEIASDMPDNIDPAYIFPPITPQKHRKQYSNDESKKNHYCYMIFNENNKMIAKTNVNAKGDYPYQFMIGVKKEYRKRGIGRWLYGLMYKKMYNQHEFKNLHIQHHPLNSSAINLSLEAGYKFLHNEKKFIFG